MLTGFAFSSPLIVVSCCRSERILGRFLRQEYISTCPTAVLVDLRAIPDMSMLPRRPTAPPELTAITGKEREETRQLR